MLVNNKGNKIIGDWNFILLNINALLVLVSYAIAFLIGFYTVPFVKVIKTLCLLFSIFFLLKEYPHNLFKVNALNQNKVLLMIVLFILTSLFATNIVFALSRLLTFIIPFLYVFFCIKLLIEKYGQKPTLLAFSSSMNLIYMIPLLSFFISGGDLGLTNIYGFTDQEGFIFVSNHFGWSSAMFLLTGFDYYFNSKPSVIRRYLLIIIGLTSVYLLLISGSRSALISVGIAFLFFSFFGKKVKFRHKMLALFVISIGVIFYLNKEGSALNERYNITVEQSEEGEARLVMFEAGLDLFESNSSNWIFGLGLFNYEGLKGRGLLESYHNSYFEVLFGGGVFIFLLFFRLFVYQPLRMYFKYFNGNYLAIFPVMIIPFFESNLTGGQFLFYPWFIFVILYSFEKATLSRSEKRKIGFRKSHRFE